MADSGLSQQQPDAAAADSWAAQSRLNPQEELAYPREFAYLRGALAEHHTDFIYGHIADAAERSALARALRGMTWEQHAWLLEQSAKKSICLVCQGHGSTDFGSANQRPCTACAAGHRIYGPLGFAAAGTFLVDRTLRPHLAALVAAAENWGEVKDRLFGTFTAPDPPAASGLAACPCHPSHFVDERGQVKPLPESRHPRRELLLSLILFRRAYFSESIFKLRSIVNRDEAELAEDCYAATRDRFRRVVAREDERLEALGPPYQGAGLVAQSVGSIDLTSDYDVTLSGVHDLACLAELNESFRATWGKESGYVFDTNIYCRDYAPVRDNICREGSTPKLDTCQQLDLDEALGDLYGLTKIRRYTSKIEWQAFASAIRRDAGYDGAAFVPPRFARIDLADTIYRNQYVQPLLGRVSAVHKRFVSAAIAQLAADQERGAISQEEREQFARRISKQTPRTLERLVSYDSNGVLRACNLAFVELSALARSEDQRLRRAFAADPGVPILQQRQRPPDNKTVRAIEDSRVTAGGLGELVRSWGRLASQSMLFAADAYYTQGAYWDVVGSQTGNSSYPLTVDHFLHCFNEQVGDAMKELRQYQRMVDGDVEARKHMPMAHSSDPSAAHLGFYRAAKYADRMLACMDNILAKLYGTASPEYRAIRARLIEQKLARDPDPRDFAPDPEVQRRRAAWRAAFPDRKSADEIDLELLAKELNLTAIFGKSIPELLLIRKARGEYGAMSLLEKKQRAKELVRATVESAAFRAAFKDKDRAAAEPRYGEAAGSSTLRTKYDAALDDDGQTDSGWGLRELTWFLLWHCAQVNKLVRRIRGRQAAEGGAGF